MNRGFILFLFSLFVMLGSFTISSAYSTNASMAAESNLTMAQSCIDRMIDLDINITRANESFILAKQQYEAQYSLQLRAGSPKYDLVVQYSKEVCDISDSAVKAKDELTIFLESYDEAARNVNLSDMDETYNLILRSYTEERFEDTLDLIQEGYSRLSEVESSQTAGRLFYETTSRNIKKFFVDNWLKILIFVLIASLSLFLSWNALKKIFIMKKIRDLRTRKDSLNLLVKKTQSDYFRTRKMSEAEFTVKMKTFTDMMRDIDRQLPRLNEDLARADLKKVNKKVIRKINKAKKSSLIRKGARNGKKNKR